MSPESARREAFHGKAEILTRHLERVQELEGRVAELERSNRHLATVAADVAHDLRSPLQAVSGFAELLALREGARLDEASQSLIARVLSAAHGMGELVEAVLERRRSSSALLDVTRFDCTDVVGRVMLRLGQDIDDAGVKAEVGPLPFVRADRVQLGRVFQNLVVNAAKATPRGRKPLRIAARRRVAAWEFSVTDNGVGVPEADRQRIFGLFERGHGPAYDGGAVRGMGLSICRAIVERHGGCIGVVEAVGGGSRFRFTLPDDLPVAAIRPTDPRPMLVG